MNGRETRRVWFTTKGVAWSTLRRRKVKLTTVGKTARIQETSREACDEEL